MLPVSAVAVPRPASATPEGSRRPCFDRFDITIRVGPPEVESGSPSPKPGESTSTVAERVARARRRGRGAWGRVQRAPGCLRSRRRGSVERGGRRHRGAPPPVRGAERSGPPPDPAAWRAPWPTSTSAGLLVGEDHVREALLLRSQRQTPPRGRSADDRLAGWSGGARGGTGRTARHDRRSGWPSSSTGSGRGEAWQAVVRGSHPADPRRKFAGPPAPPTSDGWPERYAGPRHRVLLPGDGPVSLRPGGRPGRPGGAVRPRRPDPGRGPSPGRHRRHPIGRPTMGFRWRRSSPPTWPPHGVVVVSGLAIGIDGAAHAGVLRGAGARRPLRRPWSGTGLDEVYPSRTGSSGKRWPPRVWCSPSRPWAPRPGPGLFPARNRIIAALSDVVVVVESHRRGGSLYTAEAAARRSIPVCAVPGSVRSPASAGTNGLLVDGCVPVRDATDVLVAVSLARAGRGADLGCEGPIGNLRVRRSAWCPVPLWRVPCPPVLPGPCPNRRRITASGHQVPERPSCHPWSAPSSAPSTTPPPRSKRS